MQTLVRGTSNTADQEQDPKTLPVPDANPYPFAPSPPQPLPVKTCPRKELRLEIVGYMCTVIGRSSHSGLEMQGAGSREMNRVLSGTWERVVSPPRAAVTLFPDASPSFSEALRWTCTV